jgi:hypothetical protein
VTAQFTITLNATSACAGTESSLFTETGSYSQDGDTLTLTDPYPGQADNLSGQIDDRAIVIEGTRYEFTFAR